MDVVVWVVGIFVFVALVAWFIVWFNKRSNDKFAQLWPSLASQVEGAFKGRKMTGTYNGMPVQAQINTVSNDDSTDYYYALTLDTGAQGKDWSLNYAGTKMLGMGQKAWQVKTRDEALKQRLIDQGAISTMEQWNEYPSVSYKTKQGTLKYETQVRTMHALPSAEQFKAQLELLSHFSGINQRANVAAGEPQTVGAA